MQGSIFNIIKNGVQNMTISSTLDIVNCPLLTAEEKEAFLIKVKSYLLYKTKEAEVKKLESQAKKGREHLVTTLRKVCPNLATSDDFLVSVDADQEIYVISSKASATTYYSAKDLAEKIEETREALVKLQDAALFLSQGVSTLKSPPRITFNVLKSK